MTFDSYIFAPWRLILQGINSVISNNLSLKVYTIKLQRYRDKKNWVCGKGAIFLLSSYLCVESKLDKLRCHKVVPVMLHNLTFSCWRIRNVTILSKLEKKSFEKGLLIILEILFIFIFLIFVNIPFIYLDLLSDTHRVHRLSVQHC